MTYSTIEKEILQLINQHRAKLDLLPLSFVEPIQTAAIAHSDKIATKQIPLGHDGFSDRANLLLTNLNGTSAAENVAQGQRSAEEVVQSWLGSLGHKKNIEGDFNLTGISVAKNEQEEYIFTQIFVKGNTPKSISNNPPSTISSENVASPIVEENLNYTILKLVNQYRTTKQLPSLQINPHIQVAATLHAQDMASGKTEFGHDGFQSRAGKLLEKITGSSVAENVAYGPNQAASIVQSWLDSEGHKNNIEGDFGLTGIGIAKTNDNEVYYCQIFVKK